MVFVGASDGPNQSSGAERGLLLVMWVLVGAKPLKSLNVGFCASVTP
jgi:hypothetical protein